MIMVAELDEERTLPDVGRNSLELESLEARPAEEGSVCRGEFSEVLGDVLVGVATAGCSSLGDLGDGVLADGLVCGPVDLLAVL